MADHNHNCNCTLVDTCDGARDAKEAARCDLHLELLGLRRRMKASETSAAKYAVMLREGDHRIKNSLQLVSSLLMLQAKRSEQASLSEALVAAASRVRSVADIHDALQGTGGADAVDLGAVLRKMCASLQAMAGDDGLVEIIVEADAVHVPTSFAQSLALAVNELVVNPLRHAFIDRDAGIVRVQLRRLDGSVEISVSDNGIGVPDGHAIDQGYGMTLVAMMIKKVRGELQTKSAGGMSFRITAPLGHASDGAGDTDQHQSASGACA